METRVRRLLLAVAALTALATVAGTTLMLVLGVLPSLSRVGTGPVWILFVSVPLGGLLAAGGGVVFAWWLSRGFARRFAAELEPFITLSRRIGQGDLDAHLAVARSDELGELAYALQTMGALLKRAATERETLLAGVAHDLRTPLTALAGHLEAMITGVLPADGERLTRLQGEVARLTRMVEDLLTLASARAGGLSLSRRPVDVASLTRRVVESFEPVAGPGRLRLRLDAPDRLGADVDPDRVEQVLRNLLANALRHAPPEGRVEVRLGETDPGWATWVVEDDGPGIPAALLPHVTEPFVRGDPARGGGAGSGLGLAIAKAWTAAHGGTLAIASGPEGTAVTVRLPLAADEPMPG